VAANRRDGAAGYAGNLLVGQALEVMQHYSDPLRRRQVRDGRGNGVDRQVAFDVSGRLLSGGGGHFPQQVEGLVGMGPGDPVQRPAGDNLVQPRRVAGLSLEARQLLPGSNESFLGDILGVVMVAQEPERDPVGQSAVPVDKFGVRIEIALLGPLHEIAVLSVRSHHPPRPPGDSPDTGMAPAPHSPPSPASSA
jgi:hypothetical protein